jgi:hypothetical protein
MLCRLDLVRRFLQDTRGVTSQKTAFFIVTAVKTSNLTIYSFLFLMGIRKHGIKNVRFISSWLIANTSEQRNLFVKRTASLAQWCQNLKTEHHYHRSLI